MGRVRAAETLASLLARPTRRGLLAGGGAALALALARRAAAAGPGAWRAAGLGFRSVPPSRADDVRVPEGYGASVLLRWGEPLFPDAPELDPAAQSAAAQRLQVGFNCDFTAFLPLAPGSGARGLLCVNHEYTSLGDMVPGADPAAPTAEEVAIEVAAHGMTVAEVARGEDGAWRLERGSPRNRRIDGETPMRLSGPAAGSPLVRTHADPSGERVLGTLSNCGGGVTPWGTVLTCEERVHGYFAHGDALPAERRETARRFGLPDEEGWYRWARHRERFDLRREPNEPNRFGWVVELDPYDPTSTPVKRTALGRFKHEGAGVGLAADGRAVVYMGDDERFEHLYKFVSARRFDPRARRADPDLLDSGTLFVARFDDDGTGTWLPLVPEGPLAGRSQAELLVHARLAATALGATPMDRPEDVEVCPLTHRVYVALTNNSKRTEPSAANPRARNVHGHVLELVEARGDLAATRFAWQPLLLAGDPTPDDDGGDGGDGGDGAWYAGAAPERVDALSCPDNLLVDRNGTLWVATDGQPVTMDVNDALYAVPTSGPLRGAARRFLTGPIGCEITGPELAPDGATLFVSIQHPGAGGGLETPRSLWPHDGSGVPRSGVVAVTREDGGPVGS